MVCWFFLVENWSVKSEEIRCGGSNERLDDGWIFGFLFFSGGGGGGAE